MNGSPDAFEAALARLPHGPEFRFIDRLLELVPGRSGVGEYLVRGEATFLRGHFPGEPLMPGVLLVEAAAQLAGVVAQSDPTIPPLPGLKLAALRAVKILRAVHPGVRLRIEARVAGRLGNLIHAETRVLRSDQVVLMAELTLSGGPWQTV
jgi:3-hydroxyacyl-[acyl-carrier-protein] dehydratase